MAESTAVRRVNVHVILVPAGLPLDTCPPALLPPSCHVQVAAGSAGCHDATSLLAVHFPFAAPKPASCDAPLVVFPLTSLLAHGSQSGISLPALLDALQLPVGYPLLTADSLAVRVARYRLAVSAAGGGACASLRRVHVLHCCALLHAPLDLTHYAPPCPMP